MHANATKIVYYFLTKWQKGRALPHLKITHELPKIDLYHETAVNLEKQLRGLNERIRKQNEKLIKAIKDKKTDQGELVKLEEKLVPLSSELIILKENPNIPELQELIDENQRNVRQINAQVTTLKQNNILSHHLLEEHDTTKDRLNVDIQKLKKEKRDLAITILTRWELAKALYKFSQIARRNSPKQHVFSKTLQDYRVSFQDAKKNNILQKAAEELNLNGPVTVQIEEM